MISKQITLNPNIMDIYLHIVFNEFDDGNSEPHDVLKSMNDVTMERLHALVNVDGGTTPWNDTCSLYRLIQLTNDIKSTQPKSKITPMDIEQPWFASSPISIFARAHLCEILNRCNYFQSNLGPFDSNNIISITIDECRNQSEYDLTIECCNPDNINDSYSFECTLILTDDRWVVDTLTITNDVDETKPDDDMCLNCEKIGDHCECMNAPVTANDIKPKSDQPNTIIYSDNGDNVSLLYQHNIIVLTRNSDMPDNQTVIESFEMNSVCGIAIRDVIETGIKLKKLCLDISSTQMEQIDIIMVQQSFGIYFG